MEWGETIDKTEEIVRHSHRTIIDILKWEDEAALAVNKYFFDGFWISSYWEYLDLNKLFTLDSSIENELKKSFSEIM